MIIVANQGANTGASRAPDTRTLIWRTTTSGKITAVIMSYQRKGIGITIRTVASTGTITIGARSHEMGITVILGIRAVRGRITVMKCGVVTTTTTIHVLTKTTHAVSMTTHEDMTRAERCTTGTGHVTSTTATHTERTGGMVEEQLQTALWDPPDRDTSPLPILTDQLTNLPTLMR